MKCLLALITLRRNMTTKNANLVVSNPYQGDYHKVLCVCSAGCLRSPTAAVVLAQEPFNFNTRSAGVYDGMAIAIRLISLTPAEIAWSHAERSGAGGGGGGGGGAGAAGGGGGGSGVGVTSGSDLRHPVTNRAATASKARDLRIVVPPIGVIFRVRPGGGTTRVTAQTQACGSSGPGWSPDQ